MIDVARFLEQGYPVSVTPIKSKSLISFGYVQVIDVRMDLMGNHLRAVRRLHARAVVTYKNMRRWEQVESTPERVCEGFSLLLCYRRFVTRDHQTAVRSQ